MISCLRELVSNSARRRGRNEAVIEAESGFVLTYGELERKISSCAGFLAERGLAAGDRAGLLAKNSADFICAYFAVSAAGGIPVPLNNTLSADDLARQAGICGLKALYYGDAFEKKVADIASRSGSIHLLFKDAAGICSRKKLPPCRPKKPATIIFTSGTTGDPLGVTLSHRNIISNASAVASYAGLQPSDRVMCVLPLYYIYGLSLVFSQFLAGGTVIIDNRFAYPNTVLDSIERFKATGFAGVSSHYSILLSYSDIKRRKFPGVRYFMQAGDAMPRSVVKELLRAFPGKKLYLMYGQTEAAPRLAYLKPGLAAKKPSSVGKAVSGVRIKIVDRNRRELGPGEAGELIAMGPNVMTGYWRNKRETLKVLKKGWLHTGDTAFKDEDGDIYITGRQGRLVKIGGQKVDLSEPERLALGCDGVGETAAVVVRDRVLGRRIRLFISPLAGARIDTGRLKRDLVERLPRYGRFVEVKELAALPRNSYGKVDKEALEVLR